MELTLEQHQAAERREVFTVELPGVEGDFVIMPSSRYAVRQSVQPVMSTPLEISKSRIDCIPRPEAKRNRIQSRQLRIAQTSDSSN